MTNKYNLNLTRAQIEAILKLNTIFGNIESGWCIWLCMCLNVPYNGPYPHDAGRHIAYIMENTEDCSWPSERSAEDYYNRISILSNIVFNAQKLLV